MLPLLPAVLSEDELDHLLRNFKYHPCRLTGLEVLITPFWNCSTECLPRWLAPNLVTLSGTFPLIVSYLLSWFYSPHLDTPAPRWVYIFMSLAAFFYMTMDAIDGKQARRTGSSSPLGHLFDHCVDSFCCMSHFASWVLVFLPGRTGRGAILQQNVLQGSFFLAHWNDMHTGSLLTAVGDFGVTEMELLSLLLWLVAGLVGPGRLENASSAFSFQPLGSLKLFDVLTIVTTLSYVALLFFGLTNVLRQARKGPGAEARVRAALCSGLPVLLMCPLGLLWSDVAVWHCHRLILLLGGLTVAILTCQIILCSMSGAAFSFGQPVVLLYLFLVALSHVAGPVRMAASLGCACGGLFVYLMLWWHAVAYQLTTKLGIRMFSLPEAKRAE